MITNSMNRFTMAIENNKWKRLQIPHKASYAIHEINLAIHIMQPHSLMILSLNSIYGLFSFLHSRWVLYWNVVRTSSFCEVDSCKIYLNEFSHTHYTSSNQWWLDFNFMQTSSCEIKFNLMSFKKYGFMCININTRKKLFKNRLILNNYLQTNVR